MQMESVRMKQHGFANPELILMAVKTDKRQSSRQSKRKRGDLAGLLPMLRPPSSSSGVTFLK